MTEEDYNDCVKLYADGLYRFMLKSTRQVEDARDLVQSSFEKLWEHRKEVNALKSKSYLFTIGYHKMIDLNRKNSRIEFRESLPELTGYGIEDFSKIERAAGKSTEPAE